MTDDIVEELLERFGPPVEDCGQGPNCVACKDQKLVARAAAEIERLRAVIAAARNELNADHYRIEDVNGCAMCWPHDGSWPCVSKMVADDLRNALEETE